MLKAAALFLLLALPAAAQEVPPAPICHDHSADIPEGFRMGIAFGDLEEPRWVVYLNGEGTWILVFQNLKDDIVCLVDSGERLNLSDALKNIPVPKKGASL
jgi:hypothetical protein